VDIAADDVLHPNLTSIPYCNTHVSTTATATAATRGRT